MPDEFRSEPAYLAAKRIGAICDESATAAEAQERVAREFPAVDLDMLSAMGPYRRKFSGTKTAAYAKTQKQA